LSDHPRYRFGFSDFIPASDTEALVARIYCATVGGGLRDRYFAIDVPRLGLADAAQPLEYSKGDRFQVRSDYVPCGEHDIEVLRKASDREIIDHLYDLQAALHTFVEEAIR
jgi:hypothetical protein